MTLEIISILLIVAMIAIAGRALLRRKSSEGGFDALLGATADAYRLGEGGEAEELLPRLVESARTLGHHQRAGQVLMDARAFEPAERIVEEGLERWPEDRRLRRLSILLGVHMMREESVDALLAFLEDNDSDVEARFVLARALLRLRRLDETIMTLKPWVMVRSPSAEGHSLLGRAWFHKGDLERAREHLVAAMKERELLERSVVAFYDNGMISGYDASVAVEGHWETEQDRLLLEQIESGEARHRLAHHEGEVSPELSGDIADEVTVEPAEVESDEPVLN